jgi:hypothetical protein
LLFGDTASWNVPKIVIVRLLGRQSLGLPIEPLGVLIVAACLLLVTVGKTVESLSCARVFVSEGGGEPTVFCSLVALQLAAVPWQPRSDTAPISFSDPRAAEHRFAVEARGAAEKNHLKNLRNIPYATATIEPVVTLPGITTSQ